MNLQKIEEKLYEEKNRIGLVGGSIKIRETNPKMTLLESIELSFKHLKN
jgi:hypothetical protein